MLPAQPNQSLMDGIEVLLAVAGAGKSVGSREVARRLGMEPTRVNRLLKTLAAIGLAQQDERRRYVPGAGMHVLSAMSLLGSGLVRRAAPALVALGRRTLATVAMGVLWRDHVAYLFHAARGMSAEQAIGRVGLYPATRSSIGQVLLAARDVSAVRAIYQNAVEIPGFSSMQALELQLERVRRRQYASVVTDGDGASIAVALPGEGGAHAAIAASFATRDEPIDRVILELKATANAIAAAGDASA